MLKTLAEEIPRFNDYRRYKPYLRNVFDYTCGYCAVWESQLGGAQNFHIDHYKPKTKFPEHENDFENLIWSCRHCNQYKHDYYPDWIQELKGEYFLNIRIHKIGKHINKAQTSWKHRTRTGKFNIEELHLCHESRVSSRSIQEQIFARVAREKQNLEEYKNRLFNLASSIDEATRRNLEIEIANSESWLAGLEVKTEKKMD